MSGTKANKMLPNTAKGPNQPAPLDTRDGDLSSFAVDHRDHTAPSATHLVDLLEAVCALSHLSVVLLKPDGRLVYANDTARSMLALSDETTLPSLWPGTRVASVEQTRALDWIRNICNAQSDSATTPTIELLLDPGESGSRLVRWKGRAPPRKLAAVLLVGSDVTEERDTERTLRDSLRALSDVKLALDESTIVAITDVKGSITYVNDKFVEISQYSRQELLGQNHRIINSGHHANEFWRSMWRTIGRGKVWHGVIQNRTKHGCDYWVSTTIVPFLDDNQRPYQYVAIRADISDRVRLERRLSLTISKLEDANHALLTEQAKLIQAEKLSSIGLLAAGVAHEINNPLTGVIGCVRALRSGSLPEDREREYFEAMEDGLARIQMTVRGLLDFAAPRYQTNRRVDIGAVVESSLRLIHVVMRRKGVSVRQEVESGRWFVKGDSSQLSQALVNVLLNANDATPPESEIRIYAEPDQQGSAIALCVSDEGPGVPESDRKHLCDPFFSTKPEGEGTGLGLSVTLSIIKQHGGEIRFDWEPGGGTVVILSLPKCEETEDD